MVWFILFCVMIFSVSFCLIIGWWWFSLDVVTIKQDREGSVWIRRLALPLGILIPLTRRLLSVRHQQLLESRLIQAGLQYRFDALSFFTFQCLCSVLALCVAPLICWLTGLRWWWIPGIQVVTAGLAWYLPSVWLTDHIKARHQQIALALPFVLDMMTLCVEAGLTFQSGMALTAERIPNSPLKTELILCLAEIRTGLPRAQALKQMALRVNEPTLKTWLSMIIHAEQLGVSLGPLMRTQAEQRRSERFLKAEKLALQAPVKMLFPIALCIFPCTFIVLGLPMVMMLWTHL